MSSERDWYRILGVPPSASHEEIRSAYRRLARRYHPDSGTDEADPKRFQLVQEAWEVLSDPERRRAYDRQRRRAARARRRVSPLVPTPIRYTLVMTPLEARRGGAVEVPVPYALECTACGGTGRFPFYPCGHCNGEGIHRRTAIFTVQIPPGVAHNDVLRFRTNDPVPTEILLRVAVRVGPWNF